MMDKKITTNFEPQKNEDFVNKAFLDTEISKLQALLSLIEKDYDEIKLLSNKQSVEAVLIDKAVKTTIQVLYDKVLFNNYDNAIEC